MPANLPVTKTEERAIIYQAADGQEIKLSAEIVKKYLVQGKGELVTMQELMYFLNICKARKLNPLAKDCYLVKYSEEPAAIITSIDFFRKRARAQKDCKGWKKGVIVKDSEGNVRDSYGLVMDDETLVGGWFESTPEGWLNPFRLEVNLRGYLKKTKDGKITKFWAEENQPTMIAKVAEAQGLRTLWPDEFQLMHEESEVPGISGNGGMPIIDVGSDNAGQKDTPEELLKIFDASIPKGADPALVEAYLKRIAQGNKKTVDEIKLATAGDKKELAGLWKLFPTWCKQQMQPKAKASNGEDLDKIIAPVPCPNNPAVTYTKKHCDNDCAQRVGCPAWEV